MMFVFSNACLWLTLATVWTGLVAIAPASDSTIRPFLNKFCVDCHGASEQNARLRLDAVKGYTSETESLWAMVFEAVSSGEMPPSDADQPSEAERQQLMEWIVVAAKSHVKSAGGTRRRLNRRELSASLRDLIGLPIDFAAGLPADGTINGFDTGAAGLQDAADSVKQQLDVARRAVDSIRFLEPPGDNHIAIDFRDEEFNDFRKFVEQRWKGRGIFTKSKRLTSKRGVGLYLPTQWTGDRGSSFLALPAPTDKHAALVMELRVVSKPPRPGLPWPTLWVKVGGKHIDYQSIGETAQTLRYAVRMEDHVVEDGVIKVMLQSFVEMPYAVPGFENDDRSKPEDKIPGGIGVFRPKFDKKLLRTPEQQPVPAIVIESIRIDYDHRAAWPPPEWQTTMSLDDSHETAAALLKLWMDRAWRRPTTATERRRFLALYADLRKQGFTFDSALRSTFQSVLMGGSFRYLASPADAERSVSQHAIATRLSYMLLGAPPDPELRRLASQGRLRDPETLNAQVDRLLRDPKSGDFFRPFVTQWLNMDQPITIAMSHLKQQDFRFGRHLKASMKDETVQYIAQLFRDNRPVAELVASDWTMMNDILAAHYGHNPLEGGRLRKVTLSNEVMKRRGGGVLGHAGIQSMLCWMGDNWVIYRGSWMLNHLLDDPPPPPPLEVPELIANSKENRGKTFRQLLVEHQQDANCAICHRKMDPLGFAFQNFDLSGRWRELEYEHYHRAELDGKIEWRGEGKSRPVDVKGHLPRGETFESFSEFRRLLEQHYVDDVVSGLLKRLTLYATGKTANVVDLVEIKEIMRTQADDDYACRELLKAFVRSPIFLETHAINHVATDGAGSP